MSTGSNWKKTGGVLLLGAVFLCATAVNPVQAASEQTHKKTKKVPKPELPPLPSGPTGPVQQIPLDSIAAVPPQVTYKDNQLTIVAPNSTLADVLRAVRKQTGAEIDIPAAPDRVVTHLGPGPARSVIADLLNGSRFNYVLLGSPNDDSVLTRVVLVPKGPEIPGPNQPGANAQPAIAQVNDGQPPQDANADPNAADAAEDNNPPDEAADQAAAAEAEQQGNNNGTNPDQSGVKTPQQLLQEMQQRQMMLQQQQQQQGQQPQGSGMQPHPPQEN